MKIEAQGLLADMSPVEYRVVNVLPEVGKKGVIYIRTDKEMRGWIYHNDGWISAGIPRKIEVAYEDKVEKVKVRFV